MEKNIKEFKEKGYVLVEKALSKELVDFITQYALFDEMQDFNPDKDQVLGAHSKYGDPAMESLLLKLQKTIEKNTGLKVEPTYSFYRVYRPGDELLPHIDRPACEISITVCLNYDYKNSKYEWPIFVNGTPIVLEAGDLVCYRGVDLEHWREKFTAPEGSWHVQAFLHYVDVDGPYLNYKYDERVSVGSLEKVKINNKNYITYTK